MFINVICIYIVDKYFVITYLDFFEVYSIKILNSEICIHITNISYLLKNFFRNFM